MITRDPTDRPALLGGAPSFDPPLRVTEPTMPPLDQVMRALPDMWARRGLTNHGPLEQALARAIAERLGVAAVAMTGSGTAGLTAVLRALGITGEVIVPSFTFSATAHAVVSAGARVRFADVSPDTWALTAETCAQQVTSDTDAIMAVHLFGQPCDEVALAALAARHNLALVFDAAHAFGSIYPDGRPVGGAGRAEVFSFHATKLLAMGEGGAVCTADPDLAARCHLVVRFGDAGDGQARYAGFNGKMQEWNALLGLCGLPLVDAWIARRYDLVERYRAGLAEVPGIAYQVGLPGAVTNHQYFAIRLEPAIFGLDGAELRQVLLADGIDARRYYAPPLHQHPAFSLAGAPNLSAGAPQLPPDGRRLFVAEHLARTLVCLPLYAHLGEHEVDGVCRAIRQAHEWRTELRAGLAGVHVSQNA